MRRRPTHALAVLLAAVLLGFPGWCQEAEPQSPLEALLASIPAQDAASREELCRQLVELGAPGVKQMAAMLVEPGAGDDGQARMALHALALYVTRPGAGAERRQYAGALIEVLGSEAPTSTKAFVVRQLQLAGGEEAVGPLTALLADPELAAPAAQALLALPAEGVADALVRALPDAEGQARIAVIEALGKLRAAGATQALLEDARSADPAVREAALYALAQTGAPAAAEALREASASGPRYERAKATNSYLLCLERMAESGRVEEAAGLCRRFMEQRREDEHVQTAALATLAAMLGPDAFGDLLAAMESERPQVRISARRLAVALPAEGVTDRWIAELEGRPADERAQILGILGDRGDRSALPTIRAAAEDAEEPVRVAALEALGAMPHESSIPTLVEALMTGGQAERRAARASLARVPGPAPAAALTDALDRADAAGRVEIVGSLAERGPDVLPVLFRTARDAEEPVRVESLRAIAGLASLELVPGIVDLLRGAGSEDERKAAGAALLAVCGRVGDAEARVEPLLDGLAAADVASRRELLGVLGRLGGDSAFRAVYAALDDAELRDAAVRSLCEWPDPQPREVLLGLAREAPVQTHRVLALRGYVRMVRLSKGMQPEQALELLRLAMEAAQTADGRRMVLSGVGGVADTRALDYVRGYLDDAELKAEAEAASVRIAAAIVGVHREEAIGVLTQVRDASANERLRDEAGRVLAALEEAGDYIIAWMVSGPYRVEGREGNEFFDEAFPPEDPEARDVAWRPAAVLSSLDRPWVMDLGRMMGGDNVAAYLRTYVYSPREQPAVLELGSDDGIKAWLNGEVVHENNVLRGLNPADDQVELTLREGRNVLLLKVTQNYGDWAACARLRSPDGGEIEGLEASAD